jgi:hypothetical protein
MPLGTFTPKPVNVHRTVAPGNNPESIALQQLIIKIVTDASNGSERSLQKAIGPSEIGHPCSRNVAFKVAGVAKQPSTLDPLPSVLGVAFHAWMERNLPRDEWIPESKVYVTGALYGHCDAYHIPTRTVVDWKLLGRTIHTEWTQGHVSDKYRVQAHSYGQGFVNAGYPVDRIAVAVFCRAKTLQDLYVWSEEYDPAAAQRALTRLQIIRDYVTATGASDTNRAPLMAVPATVGGECYFCSYKGSETAGMCPRSS